MIELVSDLQRRLDAKAQPAKRRWWEQYLKGEAAFRGVPMDDVRKAVDSWVRDYGLLAHQDQILLRLLARMVEQPMTEDKLAAALLLEEHLVPADRIPFSKALAAAGGYFEEAHLADWNVVDWFCVKALWALVERDGEACARQILSWSSEANLWRARASVVTFANASARGRGLFDQFPEALVTACGDLIIRRERFAKTGVGWVLRGLRESEPALVDGFVETHAEHFSLEALKSVVRGAPPEHQRSVVARWKASQH
ncbi:MAG: hypothetical protein HKN29_01280 [Rhodothermales bacterium]|nr:hypothetical protein [Rhodothermales bacterium]